MWVLCPGQASPYKFLSKELDTRLSMQMESAFASQRKHEVLRFSAKVKAETAPIFWY